MRVLALAGSPRRGGNTDILADECLRGASEAGADVEKGIQEQFPSSRVLAVMTMFRFVCWIVTNRDVTG